MDSTPNLLLTQTFGQNYFYFCLNIFFSLIWYFFSSILILALICSMSSFLSCFPTILLSIILLVLIIESLPDSKALEFEFIVSFGKISSFWLKWLFFGLELLFYQFRLSWFQNWLKNFKLCTRSQKHQTGTVYRLVFFASTFTRNWAIKVSFALDIRNFNH